MGQAALKILLVALLSLPLAVPAAAQPDDELKQLRQEIEALKERQQAMERDMTFLKDVLRGILAAQGQGRRQPQPFQPVTLSIEGNPFKGDRNAKVTLIDFSDYQ